MIQPVTEQNRPEAADAFAGRGVQTPAAERVQTDGKFFRIGSRKFYVKGVTYGPFRPGPDGSPFADPSRTAADFDLIQQLNANCLRLYHTPPPWFLDLAQERGLKLLIDCNWAKHTCFLDDRKAAEEARQITRATARTLAGHPAVFALSLANEIPNDIARWYGARRIRRFLNELARIVKEEDAQRLVTFTNFPSTEFLEAEGVDFVSFNVYLHEQRPFQNYLCRLQSLADDKPLVLSEFGMDALREGEEAQAAFLAGHLELAFRAGLAGAMVFSFTDDWFTGGHPIENWFFGLTDRERKPRPAFAAVAEQFRLAPHFPLPRTPKVSVVVASYNGAGTLPACLNSLTHLNYPDYEIILVDDGSTDDTARVASHYPQVRTLVHPYNQGLSAARNTGIAAAAGEIVAFTDSDCRVDEDWLYYVVGDLLATGAAGIGGHNIPPPDSHWVADCVAVAPGAPAHVMLDDRTAEHIPGCNMTFWKWALEALEGFDPTFRAAGDDVDVCWRLQQLGYRIAFSPGGFVWHYRRNTVGDYLQQQRGYGQAEALLMHKHPEYFNVVGGMRWRGRIYGRARYQELFGRSVIYHGPFGSGLFQSLYTPDSVGLLPFVTSLEWHVTVTLGLALLTAVWGALWPLAALAVLASVAVAVAAAARVALPVANRRWYSRPLVALLYLLQPIVRGWPRYARRIVAPETPRAAQAAVRAHAGRYRRVHARETVCYWSAEGVERLTFLQRLLEIIDRDRWQAHIDSGWDDYDVCLYGDRVSRVLIRTVAENHGGRQRLLRARLSAHWTFLAKVAFALVGGDALIIRKLFPTRLWSLLILLVIPLLAGYFHLRTRRTMRLGLALIDCAAGELGLAKLGPQQGAEAKCANTAG